MIIINLFYTIFILSAEFCVIRRFQLTRYVIPACLPTSNENVNKAFATGWHLTKYQGDMSKVNIFCLYFTIYKKNLN